MSNVITAANIKFRKLFDLFSLLSGKLGNILVGVFFLPLFAKYAQPEVFTVITVVFSLQALATMLDFGMAIIISRETAIHYKNSLIKLPLLKDAEYITSLFYLLVTMVVYGVFWLGSEKFIHLSPLSILLAILAVVLCVLQNIYFSALLAARKFIFSCWLQIFFVIMRGGATYLGIIHYPASVDAFLTIQVSVLLMQAIVFRLYCYFQVYSHKEKSSYTSLRSMLSQGKKLVLYSIAGATVLQLDKIIVAHQHTPVESAPYFLASTFCMLPITVMATPVMQFFQPKLIRQINADGADIGGVLKNYNLTICSIVLLPTILIWLLIPWVIKLWLHNSAYVDDVVFYSTILLPGIAIGALGYVPYVLLVGVGDFKFQAVMSFILTLITISCVCIFSSYGNIKAICITYFMYHTLSTTIFWIRCISHKKIKFHSIVNTKITFAGVFFMIACICVISLLR